MSAVARATPRPVVAFIVAGECRSAPMLLGENDTQHATARFLQSYDEFVFRPHDASVQSTVFLMLDPNKCGSNLCEHFQRRSNSRAHGRVPCIQEELTSCASLLVEAGTHAKTRPESCFRVGDKRRAWLNSSPWWCTMRQAWARVLLHEKRMQVVHSRIAFSRVDLLFHDSMGSWQIYPHEWHSSCAVCPDMFWFFSRKLGGQVLADTLLKPLNCSWWMPYEISWWVWHYWRCLPHPTATCGRGSKRTTFIHGLQGSFSVAGNARKGRTPMRCSGAPYLHDALGRLTDHRGTHTWACCPWQHPTAPRRSGLQHSVSATTELKLRGTFAGSTRKHDAPKISRNRHLSMKRSVQEAQTGQS
mmetsp:Transcript_52254/g.117387  ORF Transcript_52254/g.117387 Transcript_52254/m.117387 type:complete len:359 (-) Transcript_52254:564-1640(-)